MPTTLQTVSAITKELYEGSLNKQLNSEIKTLKRIERSSEGVTSEVGGKYVVFPIHTRRNAGIGSRNESELLPTAGQQGTAAGRVGLKYHYGRAELTGQTMELVKTNAQAFMSALDLEINGLKDDVKKDQNRQVYGDGSGNLGTATNTSAATNDVVIDWTGWIQDGMQVDLMQGSSVVASDRQVTAIDDATGTVTLSGAAFAVAPGDFLVRTGNYNREITGFTSIIDNAGQLYNIDPATERVWKSTVDANGGTLRAISEGRMTEMVDKIRVAGGGTPTVIFTTLGIRRQYANLLTQQRRFSNVQEFTGGFSGIAFTTDEGDIPVVADVDAPPNKMWFTNEKKIKVYREGEWQFMDRDGSMWQRKIGYDAYECTYFQYSELGTKQRNAHGVIEDLSE